MLEATILLAVLAVAGAIVYSTKLVLTSLETVVTQALDIYGKRLEFTQNPPKEPPAPPIPADLLHEATKESEEWAREQRVAHLYELYDKLQDWDKVRMVCLTV